jgi:hypothetical protein
MFSLQEALKEVAAEDYITLTSNVGRTPQEIEAYNSLKARVDFRIRTLRSYINSNLDPRSARHKQDELNYLIESFNYDSDV